MRLVILGLPGAGKGTQAENIAEKYGLNAISTGAILRDAAKEEGRFRKEVQEYMSQGELVPDEWMNRLVKDYLEENELEDDFILDGYPRTLQQAKALEAYLQRKNQTLDAVLFLDVDEDVLRQRLLQRSKSHSLEKKRQDDQPEVIENRLRINKELTESLLEFYQQRNLLYVINGEGDPDTVFKTIEKVINRKK